MYRYKKWVIPYYPYNGDQLPLYQSPVRTTDEIGHYLNILEYGIRLTERILDRRKSTLFGTFTIRFPQFFYKEAVNDNTCFCNTMELFLRGIAFTHPSYVWVRERNDSTHQHYHLALWVDGSVCKSFITIGEVLECHWCNTIGVYLPGLVEYRSAEYNRMVLERDQMSIEHFKNAIYKYSYLSKIYTKEQDLPQHVKHWHHNR